jgi:hypothetical protein
MQPTHNQELKDESEVPTDRAPQHAALAARSADTLEQEAWCDSEAPTGVAVERPLLPRPPRAPQL